MTRLTSSEIKALFGNFWNRAYRGYTPRREDWNNIVDSILVGEANKSATFVVAAPDAPEEVRLGADYVCDAQFNVNCENDPGASNLDFGWHVQVL